MSFLVPKDNGPQGPERPSTHNLDVEERTQYPATEDYATEEYEQDFGFMAEGTPEPLPVYVVQPMPPHEQDYDWAPATYTVGTDKPVQILGTNRKRIRAVVRNLDSTNFVILGKGPLLHGYLAYRLPPGEDIELTHNASVWVLADTANVDVTVMSEFALDEEYAQKTGGS